MPVPQIILDLVQRSHDSREQFRSGRYYEAQLRREFQASDYAFGIFGVRKFFVEAKKPAVKIR